MQASRYGNPQVLSTEQIRAFKARLARAIAVWGLGKAGLAGRLGTEPARVSEWLRDPEKPGASLPSGEVFLRLPAILGVNGHWLLTGVGDERAAPGETDRIVEAIRLVLNPADAEAESRLETVRWLVEWLDVPPEEVVHPSPRDVAS